MRFQSPAELNAYHRIYYASQQKRTDYLLRRQYIQRFIRETFVAQPMRGVDMSPLDLHQRLRFQPSFESQIIEYAKNPDTVGPLLQKLQYAREPRRKAAGAGLGRRQIVGHFASQSLNAAVKTKKLWNPYFDELARLGLNPTKSSDSDIYEYDGRRGRLIISYRQFEKLVSELAPRRRRKLNASYRDF